MACQLLLHITSSDSKAQAVFYFIIDPSNVGNTMYFLLMVSNFFPFLTPLKSWLHVINIAERANWIKHLTECLPDHWARLMMFAQLLSAESSTSSYNIHITGPISKNFDGALRRASCGQNGIKVFARHQRYQNYLVHPFYPVNLRSNRPVTYLYSDAIDSQIDPSEKKCEWPVV